MQKPAIPENESLRLAELHSYAIIDSAEEAEFNDIALFAAEICGTTISCISFIEKDRQWFKAKHGIEANETERVLAFCAHTILNESPNIVNDTTKDERFKNNPFVIDEPKLRFYAGFPLITPNGFNIGTIAVADKVSITLSNIQIKNMMLLAKQLINLMEIRRKNLQVLKSNSKYKDLLDNLNEGYFVDDLDGKVVFINNKFLQLFGLTENDILNFNIEDYVADEYLNEIKERHFKRINGEDVATSFEYLGKKKNGEKIWIRANVSKVYEADKIIGTQSLITDITERKQSEEALRQSEKQFEAMVIATSDIVYRMSADWSSMHPLDGRMLVASNDVPLSGWAWLKQNIPADEHARIRQAIGVAIAQKAFFSLEHRVLQSDGSIGWTASRAVPILDAHGNISEWLGAASNITERKNLENQLQKKQINLLALINNSSDTILSIDREYRLIEFNQNFESAILATYKYSPKKGDYILSYLSEKDREKQINIYKKVIQGQKIVEIDEYTISTDAEIATFETTYNPIKNNKEECIGILIYTKNISESKTKEIALKNSEQRLSLALEGGNLGLWDWDALTNKLIVNERWLNMLGLNPSKTILTLDFWHSLVHPQDMPILQNLIDNVISNPNGKRIEAEIRAKHANGEYIWILDKGIIVSRDNNGNPLRIAGTHLDITKQKQIEEIIKHKEQIISAYFNSDSNAVFILDKDLKIISYNKVYQTFVKEVRGIEKIIEGDTILNYVHEKNHAAFIKNYNNCLLGNTITENVEIDYSTKKTFWKFTHVPVKDKNDSIIGVSFIGKDISLENELNSKIELKDETILAAFNSTTDAICLINKDLKITAFNSVYAEIIKNLFNLKVSIGDNVVEQIIPSERDLFKEFSVKCFNGEEVYHEMEVEYLNQPIYWRFRFFPIKSKNGEINGLSYTAKNITDRRKLEQKNNSYNDLLEAINMINSLLLNFDNAKDINYSICNILVNIASFNMAWIGWVNEETQQVEPIAIFGDKFDYVKSITVYADERPEGQGPIGIAIRENATQIVKNAETDKTLTHWKNQRNKTKWKSSIALPIIINSQNKGVLSVYAESEDYFNHKEIISLESIVSNYIIAHDRNELKKNLLEKEYFLSSIANNAPALLSYWDKDLICRYANIEYENWIGLKPFQIVGKHFETLFGTELYQQNKQLISNVLSGEKQNFERKLTKYNGNEGVNSIQYIPHKIHDKVIGFFVLAYDITKLKQQEKRLKLDATILKNIHDAILISDLESKMLYYNSIAESMFGYSQTEVLGKRATFIQHPEGQDKANQLYEEFLNGKPSTNIWRCKTKSNDIIWVKVSSAPYYNENNELVGVIGTCIDITENIIANEKIKQSEERFRLVLENMPILFNAFDKEGNIIFWNKACENTTGYKANEVIGNLEAMKHFYPDSAHLEKILNLNFNTNSVIDNLVAKNGEIKTIEWLDLNNQIPVDGWATWGLGQDITTKVEIEKKHRELQEKYYDLINNINGIVWEADPNTFEFRFVSKQVKTILGYTPEKWISEPNFWENHIYAEDRDFAVKYCVENTKQLKPHQFEYRMISSNGKLVWLNDFVTVEIENGIPVKLRGIMIDITDRKTNETKLKNLYLRYAKQKEIAKNKVLKSLINGQEEERKRISRELHDSIGQSLSLCKVYASSLLNFKGNEAEMQKRLVELNENIRLSIAETREISANLMPSELQDYGLKTTLENLFNKINSSNNTLKINYSLINLNRINIDIEVSVFRIIQEILSNTLKHAQATTFKIDIECKTNEFLLKTTDNGLGFDLEKVKKGNGLNNIKYRVETILGEVSVTSLPKKGCSYLIKIPLQNQ
ncbi:MAG: PAS domain S-box protein [Bacteroidota bacterium]